MKILTAKNAKYVDEAKTMINCTITTDKFGAQELPFTACEHDPESHGAALFAELQSSGLKDYAAPPEPEPEPEPQPAQEPKSE